MPLERSRQLIDGVWKYLSAEQSDSGGGGSGASSVRAVDLGTVSVADVFENGPQTLYELQEGELLAGIRFADDVFEFIDESLSTLSLFFGIGTVKSFGWHAYSEWYEINKSPIDTMGLYTPGYVYGPSLGASDKRSMVLSGVGDVQAAFYVPGDSGTDIGWRALEIGAWQAATAYAGAYTPQFNPPDDLTPRLAFIVAEGTVWNADPGGTSGGVAPDFAGNVGGTVADGPDIVWYDSGISPPTTGLLHAVAEIWTPS